MRSTSSQTKSATSNGATQEQPAGRAVELDRRRGLRVELVEDVLDQRQVVLAHARR